MCQVPGRKKRINFRFFVMSVKPCAARVIGRVMAPVYGGFQSVF